ncbi:MAG: WG repeat-containing protein [Saprospiraceae bacterium]|nr:WG repeat-containing protein [Saprospiraceae bacterium]
MLDKQFTSISKLEGDKIEPFSTDLFLLRKGNYCGLMDKKGILLLPVIYDEILSFSPQILRYKQNNKWGIINYQENKIYNLLFDYIAPLQQQVSIIKERE